MHSYSLYLRSICFICVFLNDPYIFLLLLWGLSDPRIAELSEMPPSFIIKLYSETQVSGRLGMSGGISPRHAQNPLSGERRKTLSMTHHALSPPPSHHHLYIIHLINWLQRFYRIIMSLKRPFVPKSDVKQGFTTTTYIFVSLNNYQFSSFNWRETVVSDKQQWHVFGWLRPARTRSRTTGVHRLCE